MRGLNKYKSARVDSASPKRLLIMLFETLVVRQESSIVALEEDDMPTARKTLNQSRAIFLELQAGLDPEVDGDLVAKLGGLYSWCVGELIKAERERDPEPIRATLKISYELLAAWKVAVQDPDCPEIDVT